MGPGADQQSDAPPPFGQSDVVVESGTGVGVVPSADDQRGCVGEVVPVLAGADAGVFPVFVPVGVCQDLQGPFLVGRYQRQLSLALADRHAGQPLVKGRGAQIQGRVDPRVLLQTGLGVGGRVPESPGDEPQFHRAPLPDSALVSIGPTHVRDHCHQVLRPQRGHRCLCPAHPRCAPGPDPAIGPRLLVDPLERVESVLGLGEQEIDVSAGFVAAAAVLDHADIAPLGEPAVVAHRRLDFVLVVRGSQQQDRRWFGDRLPVPGGVEDVSGQCHPVPHCHWNVALDNHLEFGSGRDDMQGIGHDRSPVPGNESS